MNREEKTELLAMDDIQSIRQSLEIDDIEFLYAVLVGDGWVPYNMLSEEQFNEEWENRDLGPYPRPPEVTARYLGAHPEALALSADVLTSLTEETQEE